MPVPARLRRVSRVDVTVVADGSPRGVAVVAVRGQLDVDSAAVLHEALGDLIAQGALRIVLDLHELSFCDSIGLSALVVTHKHCAGRGGYLRLAAPTPFMLKVLDAIGLRRMIAVYASVPAATAGDPAGLLD